mmetsp:Transcript_75599/g.177512  ORF Transcript_75599/g.177512 Transcript_75599/m.177512 type:complete len:82 (+) Transcript_75599:623-868(+)
MLQAEVGDAAVVLLTSQCWDESLHFKVAAKLARECQQGTLVIDYSNKIEQSDVATAFRKEAEVAVEVSWSRESKMVVWRIQ